MSTLILVPEGEPIRIGEPRRESIEVEPLLPADDDTPLLPEEDRAPLLKKEREPLLLTDGEDQSSCDIPDDDIEREDVLPRRRRRGRYGKDRKKKTDMIKGRRPILLGLLTLIIAVTVILALYSFIIPRVGVELTVVYHEASGGGGTGGVININTKVENTGTITLDDIEVRFEILNGSGNHLANASDTHVQLEPGSEKEFKDYFFGSQYDDYTIVVDLVFHANDETYDESYTYETHEPEMTIQFTEKISAWGL